MSASDRHRDPISQRVFGFEADFAGDLRCLPMAVRRKLDLAGVKLKLVHWHALAEDERRRLLAWGDGATSLAELRSWLLERSASLAEGPARAIEPVQEPEWRAVDWPEPVLRSCAQLGLPLRPERWSALDELQRFALVKLSHPGHEHRNLPRALAEFGALAGESPAPDPPHR
ncbi:MAG: nitrate reductase associated protein [Synechococcaceae cyanobacterium]